MLHGRGGPERVRPATSATPAEGIEQGLNPLKVQAFASATRHEVENPPATPNRAIRPARDLRTEWVVTEVPDQRGTFSTRCRHGMYFRRRGNHVPRTIPGTGFVALARRDGRRDRHAQHGSRYIMTIRAASRRNRAGGIRPGPPARCSWRPCGGGRSGPYANRVDGKDRRNAPGPRRRPLCSASAGGRWTPTTSPSRSNGTSRTDRQSRSERVAGRGLWRRAIVAVRDRQPRRSREMRQKAVRSPRPPWTTASRRSSSRNWQHVGPDIRAAACYPRRDSAQILERGGPLWVAGISPRPGKQCSGPANVQPTATISRPQNRPVGTASSARMARLARSRPTTANGSRDA